MRRLLIAAFFLLALPAAHACSCGGNEPPCKAYLQPHFEAIFSGKVTASETASPSFYERFKDKYARGTDLVPAFLSAVRNEDELEFHRVTFEVIESFKGSARRRVHVDTALHEASCGYSFQLGEEYLVWAYGDDDSSSLTTSICSRTQPLRHAADEVAFLRSVPELDGSAWIYGEAKQYTFDPAFKRTFEPSIMDHYRPREEEYRALKPMRGQLVTATTRDGQRFSATVDEKGGFRIPLLAPGEYSLELSTPQGIALLDRSTQAVSLEAKSCEFVRFRTAVDGVISGVITDQYGKPVESIFVRLKDLDFPDHPERQFEVWLSFAGRFTFDGVPPGSYLLGVNLGGSESGIAATYYPGVEDSSRAAILTLGRAEKRLHMDFTVRRQK